MSAIRWTSALVLAVFATSISPAFAAQTTPLQKRLAEAKALNCSFKAMATGTWTAGAPSTSAKDTSFSVAFRNVNVDEGSADAQGAFGASFIVVRYASDYLHLMQMFSAGPLYTTTIFARETQEGRLMAVHTRHEFTDVSVPGFTSRPEMYVGECTVS